MQSVDTSVVCYCELRELVGRKVQKHSMFLRWMYVRRFTMSILFWNSANIVAFGGTCTGAGRPVE
jgi:hypothetical protein